MDIARPDLARSKRRRRWVWSGASGLCLVLITIGLARLEPAVPTVDKATVWVDTVKRGEMLRQVRGNGSLVPNEIRWIPTLNAGRIERILVWPGAAVSADTVLIELANPEVSQAVLDADWALKAGQSEAANLHVQLETQRLNLEAGVASAQANFKTAKLEAEVNEKLAKDGLVPAISLRQSELKAEELEKLLAIEVERLKISREAVQSQLAVQKAKVEQLRAQLDLKQRAAAALKIRAGIDGVLQQLGTPELPLRVGQQLAAGANVARVVDPAKLKAEIKIPETQAKDIQLGQAAVVDTRNGEVNGVVERIDPAVQNGTVTLDVSLRGPLPRGARPDLSVDGTIEIERLEDVLFVGRPVQAQPEATIGGFKLIENGRAAIRVPIELGRSSVTTVEIRKGLQAGDQIILSDMSQWDGFEKVRLK
jgi:HlyD family secretion protein